MFWIGLKTAAKKGQPFHEKKKKHSFPPNFKWQPKVRWGKWLFKLVKKLFKPLKQLSCPRQLAAPEGTVVTSLWPGTCHSLPASPSRVPALGELILTGHRLWMPWSGVPSYGSHNPWHLHDIPHSAFELLVSHHYGILCGAQCLAQVSAQLLLN